jgi:adenine-specific DNA-methyltransferase
MRYAALLRRQKLDIQEEQQYMSTDHQYQQELGLRESGPVRRVEDYTFEPIRGYPMLHWAGKRPFTSTQYYPAQHKETYGPEVNGWRNKLYWGDNLQVMSHLLKEYRGKIKLVYIDPPFDSKADYKRKITIRGKNIANDISAFEEKQYSDIWTNDEYLQYIYERIILIRELLSDNGMIYVHLDSNRGHQVRCILDEIFGSEYFRNEVIWHYTNKLGTGGQTLDGRHDNLIVYSKSSKWTYNPILVPVKSVKLQPVTQKIGGERVWLRDEEGKRLYQESASERPLGDVWDIPIINPVASERTGYPTQKPEKLLHQIITISSNPGDIVFDCFMGSGTTQAVAMKLGRRFLGADINLGAVQITTKRLLAVASELGAQPQPLIAEEGQPSVFYTGFEVYNVNNYDIFRNPVEAKELLIKALEVNPLPPGSLFDGEQDGRMVKIMPINRIATRQDLNELITGFDYRAFEKRQAEHPNQPVEKVTLVCMGHEPDLAAQLQRQMAPFKLDIQVVDILRDKQDLQFKRDSEAKIVIRDGELVIEQFYPMNLLKKLSLQQEYVEDWRELVDAVMIDWNYDGAVLQPAVIDIPEGNRLVAGRYPVPDDAGTIRVKITDLLSESLEMELSYA